jgi:hypothetical protein
MSIMREEVRFEPDTEVGLTVSVDIHGAVSLEILNDQQLKCRVEFGEYEARQICRALANAIEAAAAQVDMSTLGERVSS